MQLGFSSISSDEESLGYDSSFRSSLFRLEDGQISLGTLNSSLDRDYYAFYVTPGYRYDITVTSDSFWHGWNTYKENSFIEFDITNSVGGKLMSSSYAGYNTDDASIIVRNSATVYADVHSPLLYDASDYAIILEKTYIGFSQLAGFSDDYIAAPGATFTINYGAFNTNSEPSGRPSISGSVTEGSLLTASTRNISDEDGLGSFSYTWLRDGNTIWGANSSVYRLTQDDVGARISVKVSYRDG